MFDGLPQTEAALDLYEDPLFKRYRMECYGYAIAKRLFKVPFSYGTFKRYIKRGYDCKVFPVGVICDGKDEKKLDWFLEHPFLFWLFSLFYLYVFVPVIKPLILKFC